MAEPGMVHGAGLSMRAEAHAKFYQCFYYSMMFVALVFWLLTCSQAVTPTTWFVFVGASVLAYFAITKLVRIVCYTPGCGQQMNLTMTRKNFFTLALRYRCAACYEEYEASLFSPDIQISSDYY